MWSEKIISTPGASPSAIGKAYCNLGVLNQGSEKEIEYYKKSLEYVNNFAPRYSLGCAYATRKEYDDAITALRDAVDVAEDNSDDDKKGLQTLYRVVSLKLQSDGSTASSREEAVAKFMSLIGSENYQRLASMG